MSYSKRSSLIVFAMVVTTLACGRGAGKEEIDRLVDQRLAERGLGSDASASASSAPDSSSKAALPTTEDPVAASSAFLGRLDDLMKDYRPELPVVEDKSDVLRCVTSDAAETDAVLKKAKATLKGDQAKARAGAAKTKSDFERLVAPVNHRIDYDWATRGAKSPAVHACWFNNGGAEGWSVKNDTSELCKTGSQVVYTWKARVPEGQFIYTYSRTESPPTAPPELMTRIKAAGFEAPARFVCRVRDVLTVGARKFVVCQSGRPDAPVVRVGGAPSSRVNIGDVISVPLRDTKRDPEGVLLRTSARGGGLVWTVDAAGASLTVDSAAKCPSAEEIATAVGGKP